MPLTSNNAASSTGGSGVGPLLFSFGNGSILFENGIYVPALPGGSPAISAPQPSGTYMTIFYEVG
jgi:hypothetical protein